MKAEMTPEPVRRSALRLRLGGLVLCWRRRLLWHTGGLRFARPRPEVECLYLWAEHATLLRRLRGGHGPPAQQGHQPAPGGGPAGRPDAEAGGDPLLLAGRGQAHPAEGLCGGDDSAQRQGGLRRGGGLCQMTNLLYWMTLHTPHRHRAVAARLRRVSRLQPHPALWQRGHLLLQLHGSHGAQRHPRHLAAGAPGDGHPSGGGVAGRRPPDLPVRGL